MNVKELINILQALPEDAKVKFAYNFDGETIQDDVDTVSLDIDDTVILT